MDLVGPDWYHAATMPVVAQHIITAVAGLLAGALAMALFLARRRGTPAVDGRCLSGLTAFACELAAAADPIRAVDQALRGSGELLRCQRLELHQIQVPPDGGLPLSTLRHAWAAAGVPDRRDDPALRDRPVHPLRGRWLSELSAGRCLAAAVADLPLMERPEAAGAGALAVVPMQVSGRLWGYLQCFDAGGARRAADRDVLLLLAGLLGGALGCAAAKAQLAAARTEAESGDRAKREFLANISHEVRTPLNGVLGMTGLLLDTELDQRQREYAQVVRTSAENLLALLNDLIDLAKAEGEVKSERVRLDPLRLAEDVVAMLGERAHAKGVEIAVHPMDGLPRRVLADGTRLRQILVNLVGNAIKFTARGHILVHVSWDETENGTLAYAVEDTGIGIDSAAQASLFTVFTQGDGSTTRRFGGTGLGLAICKRLAEIQGGSIVCASQPGTGTRFTVRVPSPEGSTGPSQHTGAVPSRLLGTRVLVVEPCVPVRSALAAICRSLGLVPEEASGCTEALARISTRDAEAPRVVLVAANIPGAADLPRQTITSERPMVAILLAPVARRIAQAEAARLGFAACLVKPPRATRLADAIGRAMEKAADDTSHEETGQHRRKALKVLVVEDDAVNQLLAKAVLERDGVRVDVAGDGHEALEALARARYDAVLMDLLMPVMDGFACVQEIRRLERERGQQAIPVIAVSALDDPEVKARCRAAGMDGIIRKPFEPRHLRRILRSLAQGQEKLGAGA